MTTTMEMTMDGNEGGSDDGDNRDKDDNSDCDDGNETIKVSFF